MMRNNPNVDFVNMNEYNLVKFCPFVRKILNGNKNLALIKGQNSGTNVRKMICNNPNVDHVNMNAYLKCGEILSICLQDFERKLNFSVNQGPLNIITLVQMCKKTKQKRLTIPT